MILRFEPGTPFKTVSGTGAYQATADSLEDKAVFRAYLAAEFLARLLGAQIEESVDRFGLPDELRFLAWDVVVRLGPLFVSVSADQWDLSLDLVSPSDITPIASVFILHDLATAFLTEPRT
jgi:hypothetical protein